MTPRPDTDRLAELVGQKHQCLVRLHQVGDEQLQLVRAGHIAALLELLAYKQKVFHLLQKIEAAMDPFRGEKPESRHWRSEDDRARCAALIDENERLLREILDQERDSEHEMLARREQASRELRNLQSRGQAAGAYSQHVQ